MSPIGSNWSSFATMMSPDFKIELALEEDDVPALVRLLKPSSDFKRIVEVLSKAIKSKALKCAKTLLDMLTVEELSTVMWQTNSEGELLCNQIQDPAIDKLIQEILSRHTVAEDGDEPWVLVADPSTKAPTSLSDIFTPISERDYDRCMQILDEDEDLTVFFRRDADYRNPLLAAFASQKIPLITSFLYHITSSAEKARAKVILDMKDARGKDAIAYAQEEIALLKRQPFGKLDATVRLIKYYEEFIAQINKAKHST
jgi:hypothetical protein